MAVGVLKTDELSIAPGDTMIGPPPPPLCLLPFSVLLAAYLVNDFFSLSLASSGSFYNILACPSDLSCNGVPSVSMR